MSELDLRSALADLADQVDDRDLAGAAWRTARRRRQRRTSAGAMAGVVAVAGVALGLGLHSGGAAPTPTPPVASGPHSRPPSPPSASSSPRSVLAGLITFSSPSGNIFCVMDSRGATCDLREESWALTPAELASCGQSALAGVSLPAAGKAVFDCRTDMLPSPQRVLAYGRSITAGDVSCASATSGITCTNSRTGHGFFVSRQSYQLT